MEELKKIFKEAPKKTIAITLVLAMILNYFLPLGKVFAIANSYTISFTATEGHVLKNDNGNLTADGQIIDVRDNDNAIITNTTVSCASTTSCTITVNSGETGYVSYFSANQFTAYLDGKIYEFGTAINSNKTFAIQDFVDPEQQNNNQPQPPEQGEGQGDGQQGPIGPQFDGKAYIIWSCGTGICFKHFDNIPNFNDGNSTFYKDTDIEADNKAGEKFNLNATYRAWSTDDKFDSWVAAYKIFNNINGNIDWTKVNPADMIGDPVDMRQYEDKAVKAGKCNTQTMAQDEFEDCVNDYVAKNENVWVSRAQLKPVGEPTYKNAYVSYGDRNFKVVVYNSEYKGIAMGSLDELTYYPAEWANAFIKRDQFDISGTTKEKPAKLNAILLESTVKIKEIGANGYTITKIEALDVPEDAVAISKKDGEWKLVFSSNFYDNVVFKATDSKGGVSYFQIKRYTIDGWIKNEGGHPVLNADFYFDRTKKYTDFDLTATIEYRDGTEKKVKLEAVFGIDDGLGNISEVWELDEEKPEFGPAGKGLKRACFQYQLNDGEDRLIKRVYINAEYKGSTDTEYAGTYAGSGKGVLANIYDPEEDE